MRARGEKRTFFRANFRGRLEPGTVQYPLEESKSSRCVAAISPARLMRDLRGNEMRYVAFKRKLKGGKSGSEHPSPLCGNIKEPRNSFLSKGLRFTALSPPFVRSFSRNAILWQFAVNSRDVNLKNGCAERWVSCTLHRVVTFVISIVTIGKIRYLFIFPSIAVDICLSNLLRGNT